MIGFVQIAMRVIVMIFGLFIAHYAIIIYVVDVADIYNILGNKNLLDTFILFFIFS